MQFSILTKTFQEMLNKVNKGASNNKLLPLTSMVRINLTDKVLSLTTTDMNNFVTIRETGINGDNLDVVMPIDTISKIVAKTTTDTITFELVEGFVKLKGNGTYDLPISVDEEGINVKFPEYSFPENGTTETIKYADIRSILDNNSVCLADDLSTPALTGYYFGNNVISTNSIAICINKIKFFDGEVLLSPTIVNLLGLFTAESITVHRAGDKIKFTSPNVDVCGSVMTELEDYPAEAIESYLDAKFQNSCKINKASLLGILDRILIFVDDAQDHLLADIAFTDKGLLIQNKNNTANELVTYVSGSDTITDTYNCIINLVIFRGIINSCNVDNVVIYFGHEDNICIKIEDNNIVKIVALADDGIDEEDYEEDTITQELTEVE